MRTYKVLVIDDEPLVRRSTQRLLSAEDYEVLTAATAAEGLATFEAARPQLVILDIKLPDGSGLDVLSQMRKTDPSIQVVVITAFGEAQTAVEAMKLGAADFLKKPYDMQELLHAVRSAARNLAREKQLRVYRRRDRARYARSQMVGECAGMLQVKELVKKVARSDATNVLVTGESGTGKELVARAIHFESARKDAPLMEINCSSFQESLLENELFGHERGAFTGANCLKRGLVELCDGGTLLLDEVAEMPLNIQAKLLRFIENRVFRRVGGSADILVDIRIVTATNANLEQRIEEGRFRADLYFRLKVVSIMLPPLRDRGDDILVLASRFLERFSHQFRKDFRRIGDGAAYLLMRHPWPGNVRELENLLERIVLLEEGPELGEQHLRGSVGREASREAHVALLESGELNGDGWLRRFQTELAESKGEGPMTLRELGDAYVAFVLRECEDNRSRAARVLGLSRQGLLDKLRRIREREERATQPMSLTPPERASDAPLMSRK